jgi:hypothetical protein
MLQLTAVYHKMRGTSGLAEELLACQGLCYLEVSWLVASILLGREILSSIQSQ